MSITLSQFSILWGVSGAREKFEAMCVQLIKSEYPLAEPIREIQGDGGIDAHIGSLSDPSGVDVFQVKYFIGGIGASQKSQIRNSFRRIRESTEFKTKKWTLCIPVNLGISEKKWLDDWKADQADSGIAIQSVWDDSRIVNLLLQEKNKGIRESYFRQEHLDLIREGNAYLQQIADRTPKIEPIFLQAAIWRVTVASVDPVGEEEASVTVRMNIKVTNKSNKASKAWDVEFEPVAPTANLQERYFTLPSSPKKTAILPTRTVSDIFNFGFKIFRRLPILPQLSDVLCKTEIRYRAISEETVGEYETVKLTAAIDDMTSFCDIIVRSVNNKLSW